MVGDGLKQQYYSERARTMDGGSSGHKIGLIETNLDTDETIINGKTQSLMELGIGQNTSDIMSRMSGMGGVKVMQNDNSGKSERRPHKSMEFLLDKENHQRVLVSLVYFYIYILLRAIKKSSEFVCDKVYFLPQTRIHSYTHTYQATDDKIS